MLEKVLITGFNGSLAQRLRFFLENDYELLYLTSNKKSVNNTNIFYWDLKNNFIDNLSSLKLKHLLVHQQWVIMD